MWLEWVYMYMYLSKVTIQVIYSTRNTHVQWASCQVYASLCVRMAINDIPDSDGHIRTYMYVRMTITRIDPSFRTSR